MTNLDKSSRKIADSYLHTHIRNKETLPNKTQINFKYDLDVLLQEIVRANRRCPQMLLASPPSIIHYS
jgi:hypothetical protein